MRKLYDHLFTNQVTPNGLLVLNATFSKYGYPNFVNFRHEQHRLEITGYLEKAKKGTYEYKLTEKGKHLIKECSDIMFKMTKSKSKPKVPFEEWEHHIVRFNDMFPKGKKKGSTVYFKTNPKELFERFKWFFLEYPEYTWEDVLYATEKYVEVYEKNGEDYTYMQTSKYFIKKVDMHKQVTSNLATLCFNIANGDEVDMNDGTFYFGP